MEYSGGRRGEEEEWKSGEDTAGMGRLYECVFCKRGFTTAQALGGHMNIHRKDRAAKTNTNTISTTRPTRAAHDLPKNGAVSYPPATHHLFNFPAQSCYVASSRPADCRWNLSLQVGPSSSRVDDDRDGDGDDDDDDDDEDGNVYNNHREDRTGFVGGEELDLELRLGHGRP